MKRVDARLYILSFSMAAIGAILGFALKDGVSVVQQNFYFLAVLLSFALILVIAALVLTIQYTQQIMTIAAYIIHYIETPENGLQYERRLEEHRKIKRENRNRQKGILSKLQPPLTSSDALALFYALLTISVCAVAVYCAFFVASSYQQIALIPIFALAVYSFYCSSDLIRNKGKNKGEGWKVNWWEVDNRLNSTRSVSEVVLNLNDATNWNRWVVGTMPAIEKDSPFYSEQLQISYIKNPNVEELLKNEKMHYHSSPIEEYYLVLGGNIELDVDSKVIVVKTREILLIPPKKPHKIKKVSADLELLVLRAPISTENSKMVE